MMKINPNWRAFSKGFQSPETPPHPAAHQPSFADVFRQQEGKRTQEQLARMLDDIHKQSERLARSMTIRDLLLFKSMVKAFLEATVRRGIGLKETKGWDRRGRAKRYKIIEEVDQQLLSLADDLLKSEQGRISLLEKIGEIRGLLVNLMY